MTVGNYPGIEARIYGSQGAIIVRLVDEFGICQTIKTATQGRGRVHRAGDPGRVLPAGRSLRRAVGVPVLLQPDLATSPQRSAATVRPARATSRRPRSCRRRSTRSRRRSGSGPGSSFPLSEGRRRGTRQPGGPRMKIATNADRLVTQVLTGEVWPPLADRHALPGRPGRPAVRAARHGRRHARRALRRPGHRLRLRPPGARRVDQAPRPGREHGRCSSSPAWATRSGSRPAPRPGATGHVIGQHAYVLADFPEAEQRPAHDRRRGHGHRRGQGLALRRPRRDRA